jgi:molybdopterin-binding protein
MNLLSAREAAGLLHLNVKRVQQLAREGRLPATRVGRKWLFPESELERMLAGARVQAAPQAPAATPGLSARNRLVGRVAGITLDGLMAEVRIAIGDQELVSMITRSSAERLGLCVGGPAIAVIKSTDVLIATEGEPS